MKDLKASELIDRLQQGDESLYWEIYHHYRSDFLDWAEEHYPLDRAKALDIYQEALTGFYLNIYSGKVTELTSSLKTYIFGIAKHHLYNRLKHDSALRFEGAQVDISLDDPALEDPYPEFNERRKEVMNAMKKVGEPCKTIIEMTYLKHYSNKTIARELKYKSEDVVKATKWRCMKKLWDQLNPDK